MPADERNWNDEEEAIINFEPKPQKQGSDTSPPSPEEALDLETGEPASLAPVVTGFPPIPGRMPSGMPPLPTAIFPKSYQSATPLKPPVTVAPLLAIPPLPPVVPLVLLLSLLMRRRCVRGRPRQRRSPYRGSGASRFRPDAWKSSPASRGSVPSTRRPRDQAAQLEVHRERHRLARRQADPRGHFAEVARRPVEGLVQTKRARIRRQLHVSADAAAAKPRQHRPAARRLCP